MRRRSWRILLVATVAMALGATLVACGSSGSSRTSSASSAAADLTAGAHASRSAKMVCATEARDEISRNLGVKATRVTTPTWADHLYSCTYMYPSGRISLSVKELSDSPTTTQYFDELGARLGRRPDAIGLGQGAFVTTDGSVVVRKDHKILDVDIAKLPTPFGRPPLNPSDVALSVAATVMGCWTGA